MSRLTPTCRRPRLIAAFAASFLCGLAVAVPAAAAQTAPLDDGCQGLACERANSPYYVPEAWRPAELVGTHQFGQIAKPGFYRYKLPEVDKYAVSYVSPPGRLDEMPARVRNLPMVRGIVNEGNPALGVASMVIFSPGAITFVHPEPSAAAARHTPRSRTIKTRAWAADGSDHPHGCNDRNFCLYDGADFFMPSLCYPLQLGPFYDGSGWQRLSNFLVGGSLCSGHWGDRASSQVNRRGHDSLLNRDWPATGIRYCSESHSEDRSLGDNAIGGNDASAFANVPDDIHC